MLAPPIPTDDDQRAADLRKLEILLTEPEAELDRVTQELAHIFDVPGAFVSFIDEDTQYYKAAYGGLPEQYAATRTEPREGSLCSFVVGQNDELIVEDLLADVRFRDSPAVTELGARFYAGTPLRADSGRAVGSLCIVDFKPRTISLRERELLRLVAEGAMAMVKLQVASHQLLRRNQQIERDLRQAVQVQQFLLPPQQIEKEGWRIEHLYRPVAHLGGDFIDVIERPDGRWALLVADVSGHGTSAALTTSITKTAFRRAALWVESPAQLLAGMNREVVEIVPPGQFITATVALFAPIAMQLEFSSAGHPYPLKIGVDARSVQFVRQETGFPLGVEPKAGYHHQTTETLSPGERILLYTDGADEAQGSDGTKIGADAFADLAATAARHANADPTVPFLHGLFAGLQAYAAGRLHDDVALLCVEAT